MCWLPMCVELELKTNQTSPSTNRIFPSSKNPSVARFPIAPSRRSWNHHCSQFGSQFTETCHHVNLQRVELKEIVWSLHKNTKVFTQIIHIQCFHSFFEIYCSLLVPLWFVDETMHHPSSSARQALVVAALLGETHGKVLPVLACCHWWQHLAKLLVFMFLSCVELVKKLPRWSDVHLLTNTKAKCHAASTK